MQHFYRKQITSPAKKQNSFSFCYVLMQPNNIGVKLLQSHGLFTESYWYWIGTAALTGFAVIFNIVFTLSLQYLNRTLIQHLYFPIKVQTCKTFSTFKLFEIKNNNNNLIPLMCFAILQFYSQLIIQIYFVAATGNPQAIVTEDESGKKQEREMQNLPVDSLISLSKEDDHENQFSGN